MSYQAQCTSTLTITNAPPMPTCTINSEDCTALWRSYTSNDESLLIRTPRCSSVCAADLLEFPWQRCGFENGHMQLIYFPVSIKGNNLCKPYNYTTAYPNATTPVTAVGHGTTFTSGSLAWYSFPSLRMTDWCGNQIGPTMTNLILPVPSSNVKTLGSGASNIAVPLNFADFNSPVPAEAYQNQPACHGLFAQQDCATIYDGDFNPSLEIPTELGRVQPAWSSCIEILNDPARPRFRFLTDPPVALVPGTAIATPTSPVPKPPTPPTTAHTTTTPAQVTPPPTSSPSPNNPSPNNPPPNNEPPPNNGATPDNPPSNSQDLPVQQPGGAGSSQIWVPVPIQNSGGSEASAGQDGGPANPPQSVSNPEFTALPANVPGPLIASCDDGQCIVDGTTITAGQLVTIDGNVVSLLPGGSGLVVGSSTLPIAQGTSFGLSITTALPSEGLITLGAETLTQYVMEDELGISTVVVDGTTLVEGGPSVTVNGMILSVASTGLVSRTGAVETSPTLTGSNAVFTPGGSRSSDPAPGATVSAGTDRARLTASLLTLVVGLAAMILL